MSDSNSNAPVPLQGHADAVDTIRARLNTLQTYVQSEIAGCITQLDALAPTVKNDIITGIKHFFGIT